MTGRCATSRLAGPRVWRYLPWLPVDAPVSLGEPATPLVELEWGGLDVLLKLEGTPAHRVLSRTAVPRCWSPGWALWGRPPVLDGRLGDENAGAALAAYCARAASRASSSVPAKRPRRPRLAQIRLSGAGVIPLPGPRPRATEAAIEAARAGGVYASHAWNPLYLAGTQTFAFELWEQLGRSAPDAVVMPVGGGALLLGVHLGFRALRDAGLVDRVPRLVCAQAAACAPLVRAFEQGSSRPVAVEPAPSLADGIRVPEPVRGEQILAAIADTGGTPSRCPRTSWPPPTPAWLAAESSSSARPPWPPPRRCVPASSSPVSASWSPSPATGSRRRRPDVVRSPGVRLPGMRTCVRADGTT